MSNLLEALGFAMNRLKSQMAPVHQIQFLGFVVDSKLMKLFFPQEKTQNIAQLSKNMIGQHTVSILSVVGQDGSSNSSSTVCPDTLPAPSTTPDSVSQKVRVIQQTGDLGPEGHRRVEMVAGATSGLEWRRPHPTTSRSGDRDRCIFGRMESHVQWSSDRGLWSQQERQQHINVLELTAGMFAVQAFVKERQNVHVHLKMDNTLCKQDGKYLVSQADRSGMPAMELVSSTRDNTFCLTSSRTEQSSGRPGVQTSPDFSRMEASQGYLLQNLCSAGPMQGEPVCHMVEQPTD